MVNLLPALILAAGLLTRSGVTSQKATTEPVVVPVVQEVPLQVAQSKKLNRLAGTERIEFVLTLPVRDQSALDEFLRRLYLPGDALYQKFVTPEQFTQQFGPAQETYDAVIAFAKNSGLTIMQTYSNRTMVDVEGNAATVEALFRTQMNRYQLPDGRVFRAPGVELTLPAPLSLRSIGVVGLDDANVFHHHAVHKGVRKQSLYGYFTPNDINTAYNVRGITRNGVTLNGAGQTLALVELDGYTPSDITTYENQFGLPAVPLQNVLIDSYSGGVGNGAVEVTLDIEMMVAIAPGVTKIIVYEAPNSTVSLLHVYSRIAMDNLAKQISTSWGLSEQYLSSSTRNNANTSFQQMAAQGQSFYAAAGDSAAYDNATRDNSGSHNGTLSVDDPAAQPYVVGVGGTRLTTNGAGGSYRSERVWFSGTYPSTFSGGGGGISSYWNLPSYQSGVATTANLGSTTRRNVPDIALNADPATGYLIIFGGNFGAVGGTSAGSPLWAGFTALVNQARTQEGLPPLGFPNPALYNIGRGYALVSGAYHDIADNSTNGKYPAVAGYDLSTGWGSFNGATLITDLTQQANLFYVDASYTGTEYGTPTHPYKSVSLALSKVISGFPATLYIRGGAYPEMTPGTEILFNKQLKIYNWGGIGSAAIGQH